MVKKLSTSGSRYSIAVTVAEKEINKPNKVASFTFNCETSNISIKNINVANRQNIKPLRPTKKTAPNVKNAET